LATESILFPQQLYVIVLGLVVHGYFLKWCWLECRSTLIKKTDRSL